VLSYRCLILASLAFGFVGPAKSQAPALCNGQLSPAQHERYRMLNQACQPPREETAWQRVWRMGSTAAEADALVASEPVRLPRDTLAWDAQPRDAQLRDGVGRDATPQPAHQSAQLRLYGGAGVVMARFGPDAVAVTTSGKRRRGAGNATANANANSRAVALAPQMDAVARRHDIDPLLLHAVAHVESRHNTTAISSAGARGVMQVMPATAARFGVDQAVSLHHAATNLEVSAAYLKTLQGRFGTDLPLVLAAYNAGEGAVERYGRRIPPYAETQLYVRQVLAKYQLLTDAAKHTAHTTAPTLQTPQAAR
jgi:soluble lytic murein transglycosylase-like protein